MHLGRENELEMGSKGKGIGKKTGTDERELLDHELLRYSETR